MDVQLLRQTVAEQIRTAICVSMNFGKDRTPAAAIAMSNLDNFDRIEGGS